MKNHWLMVGVIMLLPAAVFAQTPPAVEAFAPARLASGGYVVFLRHTERDKTPSQSVLWEMDRISSCDSGGALNAQGEGDARSIARGIKRLSIPVGEVFVSPTCRTKQMARIIFGTTPEQDNFTVAATLAPAWVRLPSEKDKDAAALRSFLSNAVPPGQNRFLISHSGVMIEESIGQTIEMDQGEAAVFQPATRAGADSFEFLGIIRLKDWGGDAAPK